MPEMHSWEFLIQQDGDRAWLPLDTSDVEILEGRYRIAAKSDRTNTPVEVQIRYDAIEEVPPKRRTQTRTNQTNQSGLIVIIPFTQLQPGVWELKCTLAEGPQHSVQLRVLPIEPDLVEDWSLDWEHDDQAPLEFVAPLLETELETESPEAQPTALDAIVAPLTSVDEILHQAESESDTMADEILQAYGLVPEVAYEDFSAPQTLMPQSSAVSIDLDQATFITKYGEPLTLSGQISSKDVTVLDAELRLCLRDPQTSQPLLEACETLHHDLPFELIYRVTLPAELKTQLILGDLTLHDVSRDGHPVIAAQSFTLMSDVDELLDAMQEAKKDERATAEEMLDLPSTNPIAPPLNLTFLNFVAAPKDAEGANFTIKETSSLPPQLRQPNPYVRRKLDLPTFGSPLDSALPEDTPEGTQLEIPLSSASVLPELEAELIETQTPEEQLSCLTPLQDPQPASELKIQADDQDNILEAETPDPEADRSDLETNPHQGINEFVVDDEPILPLADLIVSRRQNLAESDRARNPLLLPDTEPVPDPIVLIADPELTVGKPTLVRIKLPDILPKIYVKLWLSDRQSRTLIDPPRWVIDFNPDGHGNLEAVTEVTPSFDSVEVQIEAIAVEVMTNRESHKVVLDRQVIAEALPHAWLDELDP